MNRSLRQLFILSVIAGIGLLALQVYWMQQEWQSGKDILKRQADYSFQKAVDNELQARKDSLGRFLENLLSDTNFIAITTKYNTIEKIWMIRMYDPYNEKDFGTFINKSMPVGPTLLPGQKERIIKTYVTDNVKKSISSDIIFFYTQRFGKKWSEKFSELKLDTARLSQMFREQLGKNNIYSGFSIAYADTTQKAIVFDRSLIKLNSVAVNFSSVNDIDKKYVATPHVGSPFMVIIKRMWISLTSSLLLLLLTLYCLYRMYRTIIKQKQLNDIKNDFISNMTHELKTPIATITAAIDGLQYFNGLHDVSRTERYLNTSRNELQRLNDIVTKVLDLALYEKQVIELKKEHNSLREIFVEIISSLEMQGRKDFSYEMDIHESMIIYGDRTHLASVFHNLIENAFKYASKRLHLIISAVVNNNNISVEVKDNGPGMEEKYLPYIFDKFYRVPSRNESNIKGFGLGLFYVSCIVKQHSGDITVRSKKGEGTIFTVVLPVSN